MDADDKIAMLFQLGGTSYKLDGSFDFEGNGVCHSIHRLGIYFKDHNQSELLRVSTEYTNFSRRP
eukprot:12220962-Prorocentrum_lima.AAC.1